MKLLDRFLHRAPPAAPPPRASPTCQHVSLVPQWDSVADMGHEDKASGFTCVACGQHFSPQATRVLRETEADRLRQLAAEVTPASDEQPPPPAAG